MKDAGATVISVRGLTVRAGADVLVEDIGFDVAAGRIVTLFGASGAGKTTIAAALAGVDRPGVTVTGEIRRDARVGYLPQNAAATLNPARRIGAALGELVGLRHSRAGTWRQRRAERDYLVRQALSSAAFELNDVSSAGVLRKFPHEFSGGERARLALAQVLACEPEVLVVDEPTVGLDSLARTNLLAGLNGLRCAGKAIVLVTHDPLVVDQLSDRVLHIRAGRLAGVEERVSSVGGDDVSSLAGERVSIHSGGNASVLMRKGTTGVAGESVSGGVREMASVLAGEEGSGCVEAGVVDGVSEGRVVLEVRDVVVRLRGSAVLREVGLVLREGELVAMIGVSGAGKTTVARCIAGLTATERGAVLLDGVPMPLLGRRTRAQIGAVQYVWQESASSFDPRRTVVDQVAATAVRLRGLDRPTARAAALDMLEDLGIAAAQALRHPAALSGGQLQRASLARALQARPRVLVCDEITTALDRPLAARILDYVDDYRRSTGAAVLSIGHDLRSQLGRADRVALVDGGRIAAFGTPDELAAEHLGRS